MLRRILPVIALLVGGGSMLPLSASLIYSNDLPFGSPPQDLTFVNTTYVPGTSADPSAYGDDQVFAMDQGYYTYDPVAGVLSPFTDWPKGISMRLSAFSLVVFNEQTPQVYFYNVLSQIVTLNLNTFSASEYFVDNLVEDYSMAISPTGVLTTLAQGVGYILDPTNGKTAPAFAQTGFSNDLYEAYGPNGLLYVLDYGNNRIQVLDPSNNYAVTQTIPLNPGVTTANMQFAIGPDGTIYLGDGEGGGSSYDSAGNFLGTFTLPAGTYQSPSGQSTSQLAADALGDVYVLDSTGEHEYVEATPEPSAWLLALGGVGCLFFRRRFSRCGK